MAGLLYNLVEVIRCHVQGRYSYEIVIGDNSTDPEFSIDSRFDNCSDITLVRLPANAGYGRSLDSVLNLPKYKYVAFLHPDVDFMDHCLEQLVDFLENNPGAGIVSPNLFYPNGQPCDIRLRLPSIRTESKRLLNHLARGFLRRNIVQDEYLWDRKSDVEVDMTMSVCMLIRREVLQHICQLNHGLKTYYLNDLIGLRARRGGYTCHYLRDAKVVHYERFADHNLYSNRAETSYKTSSLPVEARMQHDRFTFLREAYPPVKVFVLKVIALVEYLYLVFTSLPHYRTRKNAVTAYWNALKAIYHA
jgi:GT2 family glycosyltransferase